MAQGTGKDIETSSVIYAFLKCFNQIFSSLAYPQQNALSKKNAESAIEELRLRWLTDKIHRKSELRRTDLYTRADELNDRMALLFCEFKFELAEEVRTALVEDIRSLLKRRTFTSQVRPPKSVNWLFKSDFVNIQIKNSRRLITDEPQWSPWELSCKNFLVEMQLMCLDAGYNDHGCTLNGLTALFQRGCQRYRFLQHDFSIVNSRDETCAETLWDWWCTEADSLLAASLLDKHRIAESNALSLSTSRRRGYEDLDRFGLDTESSSTADHISLKRPKATEQSSIYSCSYLDEVIRGDSIRVCLHETMSYPLQQHKQTVLVNAMSEVEQNRILELLDSGLESAIQEGEDNLDTANNQEGALELPGQEPDTGGTIRQEPGASHSALSSEALPISTEPQQGENPSVPTEKEKSKQRPRLFVVYQSTAPRECRITGRWTLDEKYIQLGLAVEDYRGREVDEGPRVDAPPNKHHYDRLAKLLQDDCPAVFHFVNIDKGTTREIMSWNGSILSTPEATKCDPYTYATPTSWSSRSYQKSVSQYSRSPPLHAPRRYPNFDPRWALYPITKPVDTTGTPFHVHGPPSPPAMSEQPAWVESWVLGQVLRG